MRDIKEFITHNFGSFIRFAVVGVINTINYYAIYLLLMYLDIVYLISHSAAFIISMVGSYFLNCYFTYKTKPTLKKFLQFPLTYVVNYTVSTSSLFIFVDLFKMNEFIAPFISMLLPIPFTYLTSKWILTKGEELE